MEELLNKDLAKELLTILPYLDDQYTNNIPDEYLEKLIDLAAMSEKEFYIKKGISLSEQNISEECKNFISILYYQNSDEQSKNEILKQWIKNDAFM